MRNPYDVLGIPSSATAQQVKEAYKKLSAKYQSEKYPPEISSRKMDEINEAYDNIIYSRESSGGTYNTSDNNYNSSSSQYSNDYSDIRAKINQGRIDDAEIRLDGISPAQRNAEWYFLKGTVNHKRGWLEEARKNFTIACQMEPSNAEYRNAFASLNNSTSGGYRTRQRSVNSGRKDSGVCDICSALLCADCCCECFGGDLIPCC